ncbi:MAG: methylmalonyl Co-A mutase-associated GTPase MeaB [Alphaproteobacteria bacterium]|nr:methylmalonyl Co-A mutase-associated GTPase MeaB [Alphaproteobacteria bacterium]
MDSNWIAEWLAGRRPALARALTAVIDDLPEASDVLRTALPRLGQATVIGVTGAPGAGKSTLVGAMIGALRRQGRKVGVLAVDPSSPFSGGAVLGDRIRMLIAAEDEGVFVRSLAARGHLGGLAAATARAVDVMDAAGQGVVIVETVGVGQSEIEISRLAHVTCVVCAPGLGDDIQALKAGLLEVADVLVLNKADLPGAKRAAAQLAAAIGMASGRTPPLIETVATSGQGIAALLAAVEAARAGKPSGEAERLARVRRLLIGLATERLARRLEAVAVEPIAAQALSGALTLDQATERLIDLARRA